MRPSPDRRGAPWRAAWAMLAGAALLAGCVTAPPVTGPSVPVTGEARVALLGALPAFRLNGRVGVVAGEDGFNASATWQQRGVLAMVKLSAPVGGSLTLRYEPDSLEVTTSRGEKLHDAQARAAIAQQLGFMPPFDALRFWILGVAAPGEAPTQLDADEQGLPQLMQQQGWQIRYERWMDAGTSAGTVRVPARLTATRDALRLRLVVDRWQLR